MRRLKRAAAALLLLAAACARMAPPPGGPGDRRAPQLIGSADSLAVVPGFDGTVDFRFDEVISEGSSPNFGNGSGDLERLVILSPDTLVPVVKWHRDRISVKPRNGWRPNTVYRIELQAGLRDLTNNETKQSMVVTLVTGGDVPTRTITGRVVDWASRSAVPRALLEVMTLPDSLVYRGAADSTGRFAFGPVRNGEVAVRVVIDRNGDRRVGPNDPWERVVLAPDRDEAGEIWAFLHDTLPPKITGELTRVDSQTISIPFNLPLEPYRMFTPDSVDVRLVTGSDTVSIGTVGAWPRPAWDSLFGARAPRPSTDTTPRPPAPPVTPPATTTPPPRSDKPSANKPEISTVLMVRTVGQVRYDSRYVVVVRGLTSVEGRSGTVRGTLVTGKAPEVPKPDSTAARRDTTRARPDTTRFLPRR